LDVDVSAKPGVIGEIPAVMVGIFVYDDIIVVPVPITDVVVIVGRYAEVEVVKEEALAVSTAEAEHMAAAEAASEAAVLPWMIDAIVFVAAAGIVADPCVIVVDVRGFRVTGPVAEGSAPVFLTAAFRCAIFCCAIFRTIFRRAIFRTASPGISCRCWAVRGYVSAADVASAAALRLLAMLLLALRCRAVG